MRRVKRHYFNEGEKTNDKRKDKKISVGLVELNGWRARRKATRKGDEEMEIGQPSGSYHSISPLLPLLLGEANQIKKPKGLYTPYNNIIL